MNSWLDTLTRGDQVPSPIGMEMVVLAMVLATALGHVIGWIYMFTHTGLSYSQTFVASLVVIPAIVALTMVVLTGDVMVAFGLLAIFAVVRFRNVLKDTRDTTFILWAILQGMAIGTMRFGLALTVCMGLAATFVYLRIVSFGARHRYDVVLSLQSNGAALAALPTILGRHSLRVQLASQRDLADERVDVSYRLLLRDPARGPDLVRELQSDGGFEQVSIFQRSDEAEV